ncbi:hypothetical protein TWF718_004018 [Orbilia javanica]|uniref:Uncharacterized protein n=1 Tax=Orbilia javanica TaxID=47235 RepID=A0AAN8NAR4_9PEZI
MASSSSDGSIDPVEHAPEPKNSVCVIFSSDSGEEKIGKFTVDPDLYRDTYGMVFEGTFRKLGSEKDEKAMMRLFSPENIFCYKSEARALRILNDCTCVPKLLAKGCTLGCKGDIPGGLVIIKTLCPGQRFGLEFWCQFTRLNGTEKPWVAVKEAFGEVLDFGVEVNTIIPDSVLWHEESGKAYLLDFDDWSSAKYNIARWGREGCLIDMLCTLTGNRGLLNHKKLIKGKK